MELRTGICAWAGGACTSTNSSFLPGSHYVCSRQNKRRTWRLCLRNVRIRALLGLVAQHLQRHIELRALQAHLEPEWQCRGGTVGEETATGQEKSTSSEKSRRVRR